MLPSTWTILLLFGVGEVLLSLFKGRTNDGIGRCEFSHGSELGGVAERVLPWLLLLICWSNISIARSLLLEGDDLEELAMFKSRRGNKCDRTIVLIYQKHGVDTQKP